MKPGRSLVCLIATFLIVAFIVISFGAQEVSSTESLLTRAKDDHSYQTVDEKNPLKPADTSSPRDTLRSFLKDMNFTIGDFQQRGPRLSPAGYRAYVRALSTMDFSTTPDSNSRNIMNQQLKMLHEILARLELPPENEIPGDDGAAQDKPTQWTIPGSRITIKRIENGPRAGEYLFSAWTVQRLRRFYRQVKHQPYRPDATPGIYEASLRSKNSFEGAVGNRLKPVDTSCPRSTFEGFLDSVNRAYALVRDADAALKVSPPTMTRNEASEIEVMAMNLMNRAESTIDLSQVPKAVRDDAGIESVLQLKEIFDRMHFPVIESIPDMEMVRAERESLNRTAVGSSRPVRWRYPNTTIEIVEIMEGERQGEFLFSARTVSHLDQFYKKVRDLPYREDYSQIALEYLSPDISEGFYDYYISTPGRLIPQVGFIGRLVESLPAWFKTIRGGQTFWQWISLVLSLFLSFLFLVAFHGRLLVRPDTLSAVNRHWRRFFFNLVALGTFYSPIVKRNFFS